jgi:hypothetical protein
MADDYQDVGPTGWDVLDAFRVQNRKLPRIADAIDETAIALVRYTTFESNTIEPSSFDILRGDIGPQFRSPRLRMLLRYWSSLRERGLPLTADVSPQEIEPLLPNIMMVELSPEPLRVFYRHVGSEVAKFTGLEFTGHYLDEFLMDAFNLDAVHQAYRTVRDSRMPGVGVEPHVADGVCKLRTEYLICPLQTSGKIDHCIVVEDYFLGEGVDISELLPARWAR